MFVYYQCVKCGRKYYPPKKRCVCGSTEFKKIVVDNAIGELVTYTTIYVPPQGFEPPIRIAIAKVNGMNILGRYEGERDPYVGMKVTVDNENGKTIFRPAVENRI